MEADDPRHGTTRGHAQGCREDCCREARNADEARRRKYRGVLGIERSIDATGSRRRIQALMAIGHPSRDIAARCGWSHGEAVLEVTRRQWVQRKTAATVARVYDEMCMTVGPSALTRRRALAKGWPPPLAWDDIDHDAKPVGTVRHGAFKDSVDEAMIDRVLRGGERPRKLTKAEAREVYRRALANGMTTYEIQTLYGLNLGRYSKDAA
jgi:hypothetical protein